MKENIFVIQVDPLIMSLSHHIFNVKIFLLIASDRWKLNKAVSTIQTERKVHARKGKSLVAFNAKKIFFKSCKTFIQNLPFRFTVKIIFFAATLLELYLSFTILR